MNDGPTTTSYRERLTPSWWVWVIAASVPLMVGLAYAAPFTPIVGWLAALLTAACVAGGLVVTTPRIEVGAGELRAGRARIDIGFLGQAIALDREAASLTRGRDADPRAWMLLRGWIPQAVRINLDDPADPTPYWFVSSRHPQQLVAAIEHERSNGRYGRMSA